MVNTSSFHAFLMHSFPRRADEQIQIQDVYVCARTHTHTLQSSGSLKMKQESVHVHFVDMVLPCRPTRRPDVRKYAVNCILPEVMQLELWIISAGYRTLDWTRALNAILIQNRHGFHWFAIQFRKSKNAIKWMKSTEGNSNLDME